MAVDFAGALDADKAVSALVFDGAADAGVNRQFLGGEELFAIDLAIDDPAVHEAFFAGVCHGDGFEVVVVLEVGVEVRLPVKLIHDEVKVLVLVFGHVFDEEVPGNVSALDHALVHAEDI